MPVLQDIEGDVFVMKEGEVKEFQLDYSPSEGERAKLVSRFSRYHEGHLGISIGGDKVVKVTCFKLSS